MSSAFVEERLPPLGTLARAAALGVLLAVFASPGCGGHAERGVSGAGEVRPPEAADPPPAAAGRAITPADEEGRGRLAAAGAAGDAFLVTRAETWLDAGGSSAWDSLRVRVFLLNEGSAPVDLAFGACPLRLRAYRGPERAGAPVWRSEGRTAWESPYNLACPAYRSVARLDGGEEISPREFQLAVPLIEILGDSLPDGRYHLEGELRIDRGSFRMSLGAADLRLQRPPLPASRRHGTLEFTAGLEVLQARPTIIRAAAAARLTHSTGLITRISASCPLVLLGYRSAERRDRAPLSGAPDISIPAVCTEEFTTIGFLADRVRDTYGPAADTLPTDTQRLQLTARADELLSGGHPPGRYYFAVAVRMERRIIYLAAGDAVIRR